MVSSDGAEHRGRWLVVEELKRDGNAIIALSEFEQMRLARQERWAKTEWGVMQRAIKCAIAEFFRKL